MIIPNLNELNCAGKLTNTYINKHYPEFYEMLTREYSGYSYIKFSEIIYCYYHNIREHPVCPICSKPVKFLDINNGYQKFCSSKCAANSIETKEKLKTTNLKKFGVEHPCQNQNIKSKLINTYISNNGGMGNASESVNHKMRATMFEKYGVKHARLVKEFNDIATKKSLDKIEETISKTKNTMFEKYGGYANQTEEVKLKIKQTCVKKYGGQGSASDILRNKIIQSRYNNEIKNKEHILDIIGGQWKCRCPHPDCDKCQEKYYLIHPNHYYDRVKNHIELCTNLLPIQKSHSSGTTLELVIRNILDKYDIEYKNNVRGIIGNKELDIYIPSKRIAIECNGCYWHSSNKNSTYHKYKYEECLKNNIQLITIWEDWIVNKYNIIESLILSKLGIYKKRIGARQCQIKEINSFECNNFLNQNHIQGSTQSSVHLGLYYKDDLVAVMTFGHKRPGMGNKNKDDNEWELSRFCSLINMQIIGGSERLIKYFIVHYDPSIIYSFSCHDISNGDLYKKLGFKEDSSNLAYWYIDSKTLKRYHRSSFTKQSIIERGWKDSKDGWTESEVMKEHGYLQIYDSGQTKWILTI